MATGAAAGWAIEATRALVSVWGQESVYSQLNGVARNRSIRAFFLVTINNCLAFLCLSIALLLLRKNASRVATDPVLLLKEPY